MGRAVFAFLPTDVCFSRFCSFHQRTNLREDTARESENKERKFLHTHERFAQKTPASGGCDDAVSQISEETGRRGAPYSLFFRQTYASGDYTLSCSTQSPEKVGLCGILRRKEIRGPFNK